MNNVLVVGAGSIGTLIGVALVRAGLEVTFAGKPKSNYTKLLKKQGLKIIYPTGESYGFSPFHSNVSFTDTQQYQRKKFDLIIVALKSNDLLQASVYIKHHSTPKTIIVHAQNGIPYWWFNNETYLQSLNSRLSKRFKDRPYLDSVDAQGVILNRLKNRQLVGCVIKAPCKKIEDGCIKVTKPPKLILGLTKSNAAVETQKIVEQLCQTFSTHDIPATHTDNIRAAVCNKLAINLATNVLSALTGKIIADLTANSQTNKLIKVILREINQIFQLYAIQPQDLPTESQVYSYIQAPGSQTHLPSLAQDFLQHRQGEISLITAPVEMAQIAKIKAPALFSLAKLLQLGQNYTLNKNKGKFNILTFDNSINCFVLTNDVYQNYLFKPLDIAEALDSLAQINVCTLDSMCYSA